MADTSSLGHSNCSIRLDTDADYQAVRTVNELAFERPAEADLVDALRVTGAAVLSLVAEQEGNIVGHILFSPVSLSGPTAVKMAGLAPMAVLPSCQRQGIGSALVREGLRRCKDAGFGAVVVLGHPQYYPRFGFVPAAQHGLRSEYDVPDDVFMVVELRGGALTGTAGLVRYDKAFAGV